MDLTNKIIKQSGNVQCLFDNLNLLIENGYRTSESNNEK
jgi:hypothetical protein